MNICTPYTCLNPAFADDIQPSNLVTQNAWFNGQNCYIQASPQTSKTLKSRPTTTNVAPFSEHNGTPISHNMQSFIQPFQLCKRFRDIGNDKIKDRNLWNERGKFGLDERPSLKPCLPDKIAFTRKGIPNSRDGIAETANNLKSIPIESDLIGRSSSRPLVKNDTAVLNIQSRQICADQELSRRACPRDSLVHVYDITKINPILLKEQLHNEFTPYADANTVMKTPKLFRNSTKSRMTNPIHHHHVSSRTT